jgi:hypothetical protein
VILTTTIPRFCLRSRGIIFLVMISALSCARINAQCSQASRPGTASPQPASALQNNPSIASSSSSSSTSDATAQVRFTTGTPITVLEETPMQVMNNLPISSRTTRAGAKLSFTVTHDVIVNGILVIPCGAQVDGTVVEAKQAGRLIGTSNLTLQLNSLSLDGKSYSLYTPPFKVTGLSKTRPSVAKISTGAVVGAAAMEIDARTVAPNVNIPAGAHAFGDGLGATVGAGVGAAIAASSPPSIALIPAESELVFTLASPIAVYPVDQKTAVRLAQGLYPGGPVLYIRGENQ